MKKLRKIFCLFVVLGALLLPCCIMSACGSDKPTGKLDGKTFVQTGIKVVWLNETYSDDYKNQIESNMEYKHYKDDKYKYTFNNGKATMYGQLSSGKWEFLAEADYTLRGDDVCVGSNGAWQSFAKYVNGALEEELVEERTKNYQVYLVYTQA